MMTMVFPFDMILGAILTWYRVMKITRAGEVSGLGAYLLAVPILGLEPGMRGML